MPSRLTRSARVAIAGVVLACGVPAVASAANTVAVPTTPINKPLTKTWSSSTVTVRSVLKTPQAGLVLQVRAPKGVQVVILGARKGAKVKGLPTLKAKASTKVQLRVRRTAKGPKMPRITLKVVKKGKTVGSGTVIVRKSAPKKKAPAKKPPLKKPTTQGMEGRYFWGSNYTLNGTDQNTLLFTQRPHYVFTGDAEGSYPTCTPVTEDCATYTYQPKTNRLMISGKQATLEGTKLTYDGDTYWELGRAKAGARWDTVVTYSNSSGVCPLYCNYFTEHLTFRPDGTFIRSSVTSGTGAVVDYAIVPADSKGTYEVRGDGTLVRNFADGTTKVETLGIFPDKNDAYPANPTSGIVLDGDGYFDIRD